MRIRLDDAILACLVVLLVACCGTALAAGALESTLVVISLVLCTVGAAVVAVLVRDVARKASLFDIRLAPLYSLLIFVVPRVVALFADFALQRGAAGQLIPSSSMTGEELANGALLMLVGILLYALAAFTPRSHGPTADSRRSEHQVLVGASTRAQACLLTLSMLSLVVYLGILFVLAGSGLPGLLSLVSSSSRRHQAWSGVGQGILVLPHALSVMFSLRALAEGRQATSRTLVLATLVFAATQSAAMLPLGNRLALASPLLMWLIVADQRHILRVSLWSLLAAAAALPFAAVALRNLRYGATALLGANTSAHYVWTAFTSELVNFDVLVRLYSRMSAAQIQLRLGGGFHSLSYFLPSFLVHGPKALSADFQLSVLLGFASTQPYGTPPTLFGGLLWNFGVPGLVIGSFLFGRVVRRLGRFFESPSISARVSPFYLLLSTVLFVFLIDLVRVGVLMREMLTLLLNLVALALSSVASRSFLGMWPGRHMSVNRSTVLARQNSSMSR